MPVPARILRWQRLTITSASAATVVRLGYLTLYNNPAEFMYSTGAIGLWSILEEGIGIIAGSMPALRPLLNLPFFSKNTYASNTGSNQLSSHMIQPNATAHKRRNQSQSKKASMELNDFRTHLTTHVGYGDGEGREQKQSLDDSDSQKYILKSTRVVVTREQA
ncbi:hypothetical protein ACHAPA_005920 [Fusarium lateritium]